MSERDIPEAEMLRREAFKHLERARRACDHLGFAEQQAVEPIIAAIQCLTEWATHAFPDLPPDTSLRAVPSEHPGHAREGSETT